MNPNTWLRWFLSRLGFCGHLSHRAALRCWRGVSYGNLCPKHNTSCWYSCDPADQARIDGPR